MASEKELMDFIKSLDNRGLLSKGIDEFDYEWVIWDYQRIKVKKLPIHNVVEQSEQLACYTCNCTRGNAPKGDNFCNMCDHYF